MPKSMALKPIYDRAVMLAVPSAFKRTVVIIMREIYAEIVKRRRFTHASVFVDYGMFGGTVPPFKDGFSYAIDSLSSPRNIALSNEAIRVILDAICTSHVSQYSRQYDVKHAIKDMIIISKHYRRPEPPWRQTP
jgi:hypothetical protein